MTPGFSPEVWASNLREFQKACANLQKEASAADRLEYINNARAYFHILKSIASRYEWPPGQSEAKLRAMVPESVTI